MNEQGILDNLLPQGFHASILLPILVGILVLLFFTERLGWVYVGLVVPGYLSAVLALEPNGLTLGMTIVVEAVVSYLFVRFLSDVLARTGVWSPFFGRERFFLIVLVSIVVRQNSQVWLSPLVIEQTNLLLGTDFIFEEGQFASVGTVLVPLIANMFWKINLGRGFIQIGIPVAITYLVLRLLLLPYTNLDFEDELTLEAIALDFLNTPKVYIILLVGAILAARFNVLYGWDYNGIMVPSLMALSWVDSPVAIPITLVETVVLYLVARLVLALPLLRSVNLEGPRQIALVFALDFLLKYGYAWGLSLYFPSLGKITDFFGFGYIITSLLAAKMLRKGKVGVIVLPTLHVSLVAVLAGSLVGWGLDVISPKRPPDIPPPISQKLAERGTDTLPRSAVGVVALAAVRVKTEPPPDHRDGRPLGESTRWSELWRTIDVWLQRPEASARSAVDASIQDLQREHQRRRGRKDDYRSSMGGVTLRRLVAPFNGRKAYGLFERQEQLEHQTGWETAVLIPGAPGPIITVPRPRTESPLAEVAAVLCEYTDCRAIVIAGIDSADRGRTSGDALAHPRSTFFLAIRELRSAALVELRGDERMAIGQGSLHQRHKLPDGVNPKELWPLEFTDLQQIWEPPPGAAQTWSLQQDSITLRAHRETWWKVLEQRAPSVPQYSGVQLETWLDISFDGVSTIGAEQTIPSVTETRFLELLLTSRLLEGRNERMGWLDRLARLVDYRIVALPQCTADTGCWVLAEDAASQRIASMRVGNSSRPPFIRRWGTLAVKSQELEQAPETTSDQLVDSLRQGTSEMWNWLALRPDRPLVAIEVPRPALEAGTWQLGLAMWQQADSLALLVGHDIPATHGVPILDPTRVGNVATPFQAMHQGIHSALAQHPGSFIAQVRGFATWRGADDHLLIGLGFAVREPGRRTPPALRRLLEGEGLLSWLRPRTRFVGGDPDYIFLRGKDSPQMALCHKLGRVDCALLWFSQPVRQSYADAGRSRAENRLERAGFYLTPQSALDVLLGRGRSVLVPSPDRAADDPGATPPTPSRPGAGQRSDLPPRMRFESYLTLAEEYAVTQDMRLLIELRGRIDIDRQAQITIHWSSELALAFLNLQFTDDQTTWRSVVLLTDIAPTCPEARSGTVSTRAAFSRFLHQRCRTIVAVSGEPPTKPQ